MLTTGDTEQVRHAIRAVGRLRKRKLVGRVIDRLGDLGAHGRHQRGAGPLRRPRRRHVARLPDGPGHAGRRPARDSRGAAADRDAQAHSVLAESMLDADTQVRYSVISALNKLGELHPTWPVDRRLVETCLAPRSWATCARTRSSDAGHELSDPGAGDRADARSDGKELERIFRLLKLIYPTRTSTAPTSACSPATPWSTTTRWSSSRTSSARSCGRCCCRCSTAKCPRAAMGLANRVLGTGRQQHRSREIAPVERGSLAAFLRRVRDWCAEPRRIRWTTRASLYGSGPAFTGNSSTSAGEARQRVDQRSLRSRGHRRDARSLRRDAPGPRKRRRRHDA